MLNDPILYSKLLQVHEALSKTDKRINELPHVSVPEQVKDTQALIEKLHEHLKEVDDKRLDRNNERKMESSELRQTLEELKEYVEVQAETFSNQQANISKRIKWLLAVVLFNVSTLIALTIRAFL